MGISAGSRAFQAEARPGEGGSARSGSARRAAAGRFLINSHRWGGGGLNLAEFGGCVSLQTYLRGRRKLFRRK